MELKYTYPAEKWNQALPIGNGSIGGLVYGQPFHEMIELNEDSLWSGGYTDRNNADCKKYLEEIRKLLHAGKTAEAEDLSRLAMHGIPVSQRCYQTLGEMRISFHDDGKQPVDYTRSLSLEDAVVTVDYTLNGIRMHREGFASFPGQVMAMRFCSPAGHAVDFDVSLFRKLNQDKVTVLNDDRIQISGITGKDGISYCAMLKVVSDGRIRPIGESIVVSDATNAELYFAAATSFRYGDPDSECAGRIDRAIVKGYEALKDEHVKDYKKLFDRFSLSFTARNDNENIPTNERIENFRNGKEDPGLIAECVQYGRYLLISSSREGSLAANLQGIWCNEYTPSWDSKYTININLQMNYWFADSGNLFECEGPLFDLIRRMDKNGETTARVMYGCHGSLAHHNCDLYADTAPQDHWTPATIWVLGNAWMCYHIWEHYRYSLDSAFLNDNFRIIENQIRFFLEYLVKNDKGEYIINPSVSPENSYIDESGRVSALCEGCAMDSELLDGLFTIYEESCRILGKKSLENVEETRREIAKVGIDEDGSILEWLTPKRETEPGHRHFSPVFGVYPGENINRWDTPELFEAAEKTIEKRISHGSGHEGWSCTWAMALLARLYRRDEIYPLLVSQIGHCMYDNLLNGRGMVPDKDIFQIDGNFGLTAAMIEMLVQSHHGKVVLLPALPEKLSSGSVAGLRLRGNMVLSMQWKDGHVTAGKIVADSDNAFTLVMNGHESRITIAKGDTFCLDKATD